MAKGAVNVRNGSKADARYSLALNVCKGWFQTLRRSPHVKPLVDSDNAITDLD
jgi:hypothetical protein